MLKTVKVKSIYYVGVARVIDICVPDTNNFFLANNILSHNSSVKPVQEKFHHKLMENETPRGYPIVTLRPTFFKSLQGEGNKLAPKNVWYSHSFRQMEEIDFRTIVGYDNLTLNQKIGIELVWEQFKINKEFTLDNVDDVIDGITEFNDTQKIALKFKFRPIKKSSFFEAEHKLNIVQALAGGISLSINMESFEKFGRENSYPDAFLGMVLREIIGARRAKQIPETVIFLDEMGRFIPRERNPSCKVEITESYSLDTRYGITYCGASQNINDVPEEILKQSRYILVPYSANIDEFKIALTSAGIVKNVQSLSNTAFRIRQGMKKFDWMIIDRNEGNYEIINPLAPLSWHEETTKD